MDFDTVDELIGSEVRANIAARGGAVEVNDPTFLAMGLAGETLHKSPRFKMYDVEELGDRMQQAKLTDDEQADILAHLPFDSFCIRTPAITTFFVKGDALKLEERTGKGGILWTAAFCVMHQPDMSPGFFAGPLVYRDNQKYFAVQPTTPNFDDVAGFERAMNDLFNHACECLYVLSLFSNNLALVTIPDALQKKRAKNGKFPNFEYRIITLDAGALNLIPKEKRFLITNRLAPRCHLRRGHWRHLKSHKRTFVRSAIVGLKNQHTHGRISKDYALTI